MMADAALLESLKNGWYYSSQGALIHEIAVSDDKFCIAFEMAYARVTVTDDHGRHAWSTPIWFDPE